MQFLMDFTFRNQFINIKIFLILSVTKCYTCSFAQWEGLKYFHLQEDKCASVHFKT